MVLVSQGLPTTSEFAFLGQFSQRAGGSVGSNFFLFVELNIPYIRSVEFVFQQLV